MPKVTRVKSRLRMYAVFVLVSYSADHHLLEPTARCKNIPGEGDSCEHINPESLISESSSATANSLKDIPKEASEAQSDASSVEDDFIKRWNAMQHDKNEFNNEENAADTVSDFSTDDGVELALTDSVKVEDIADQSGGWESASEEYLDTWGSLESCEIDEVDSLTYDRFYREYYHQKPVKIRGGGGIRVNRSYWQKPVFIKEKGDELITVGEQNVVAVFAGYHQIRFKDWVENLTMPDYSMTFGFSLVYDAVANRSKLPVFIHSELSIPYMSLVRSEGGITLHSHDDVFFQVIFGSKRWGFGHPSGKIVFDSQLGYLHFLENYLAKNSQGRVLECIQNAGEMIYIPKDWYHGSLSFGETVGLGFIQRMTKPPKGYNVPLTWTEYVIKAAFEAKSDLKAAEKWFKLGWADGLGYSPKFNAARASFHYFVSEQIKKKDPETPEVNRHLKYARKFWIKAQILSPYDQTLQRTRFFSPGKRT